jgi:hypothetical protein
VLKFLKKFKAAIDAKSKLGGNGCTIKDTPRKIFKKLIRKCKELKLFTTQRTLLFLTNGVLTEYQPNTRKVKNYWLKLRITGTYIGM